MVKALETAHLPTMSGGLTSIDVVVAITRSLPFCPLSVSTAPVLKGISLGSDE